MDFIVLAVPAVVTAVMFGVKKLAGPAMFANSANAHPFLRFALIPFPARDLSARRFSRETRLTRTV
jgi:hypothetical protein